MSKEKSIRDIQKELVRARRKQAAEHKETKSRDFSHIGPDIKDEKKTRPNSADVPDYIGLPKKQKRTENKW